MRAALLLLLALAGNARAAPGDEMAIRAVMRELEAGVNARDTSRILAQADKQIVMVSKNGDIVPGRPAVAAYLDRMFGAVPALKGLRSRVVSDGPPVLHGDTAIVVGRSFDEYAFSDGMTLSITTSWSATLVRDGQGWKIVCVHFSFDLFDNPLLTGARRLAWLVFVLAMLAAMLFVWGRAWHNRHSLARQSR